jgi:WD40 repeat protein/serine/threonine protein kinase/tetratricopeptide (TPR) repeat protein
MAETARCPSCDDVLPADAPRGLCPQCLLRQFIGCDLVDPRDRGHDPGDSGPGENGAVEERPPARGFTDPGARGDTRDDGATLIVPPIHVEIPRASASTDMVGRMIGPYRIVRELGTGGMGAVYEASQEQPVRRTVALKIIRPGMDTGRVIARFEAERQALAIMDHPNIARVLDAGSTPEGQPYFVMELVRGVPITRFCEKQHLGYRERFELFVSVCQALQHAHQKGVIHRDIKPSNVLVATYDGRAVPKVIDFGLAKAIGQPLIENVEHTGLGTILGTLPYMSPEQAGAGPDVDTRTDVYALGVLLYELLTGTTPLAPERLKGAALAEVLRVIREEEPPRPSRRLATSKGSLATISSDCWTVPARLMTLVRRDLDWIVMKAIEKDRSRRYETASGLAADVLRYLADEPVEARPPSRSYRIRKFARRHRAGVAIAGLILIALVALVSVSAWFTLEIRQSLSLSNRRLAALYYERGQTALDNDQIGIGLLMMAESWRWAAAGGDPVWQHTARANLSAWRRQLPRARAVYLLGEEPIQRVAFGRDGRTFVAKTRSVSHMREVSTGRPYEGDFPEANPFIEGAIPDQFVRSELHSPPPGTILEVGWVDHEFRSPVRSPLANHPRSVPGARLWNADDGKPIGAPMLHSKAITCWTFGPDGKTLLTGTADGHARLWDVTDGSALCGPMMHPRAIVSVAFSPDGKAVVTVSADDQVRIWNASNGSPIGAPMAHPRRVFAVAFSPDSKTLLTGGADGLARRWDAATGAQRGIPMFHPGAIHSLAFRPDGKAVLLGGADGSVRLWELEAGAYADLVLGPGIGIGRPVVTFSTDGRSFFNGKWLREVATGRPIGTALASGSGMRPVALGPNGKIAFARTSEGGCIWDTTTGRRIGTPLVSQFGFKSAAFSPDGRTLLTLSTPQTMRWYDAATGHPLGEPVAPDRAVENVIFGPDASPFLTTRTARGGQPDLFSLDGRSFTFDLGHSLRLWDAGTRKPIGDLLNGHGDRPGPGILALAFRLDGKVLLTGSEDGSAAFWDAATARLLGQPLRHPAAVRAVAISPDGMRVLTACDDGAARLWDAASGRLLGTPLTHQGPVRALAFSPDGRTLLTGGEDNLVRIWDALTLKPLGSPLIHPAPVTHLAFSPDAKTFRALIEDRTISPPIAHYRLRIWNAAELPDDFPRVEDWIRVLTDLTFDARGTIRVLDRESWVKASQRLGNSARLDLAGMDDDVGPLPEEWTSPDPTETRLGRAERRTSEGKIEEAVEELRKAIRLSPHDHVAHTALARALRQLGRLDEALAECREALRLHPKYGWAMQVRGWILLAKEDWDGAIAAYQQAAQNGQAWEAPLHHELGFAFLAKGQVDEAIAEFRVAYERNVRYEPARESLCAALRDAGRRDELVEEFRAVIRRNRDDAMAHVYYCRALIWAGRLDEAIAASREAVRIMPDFGPAWHVHAWSLLIDRDWSGAIAAYNEAIRRGPENAAAHNELGIALRGRGRLDEALSEFQRALELAPGAPEISWELDLTKRQQALAPRLAAVLRGDDRPAKAAEWLDLAYLCASRNRHAAAARMFAEAFKADPALAQGRDGLDRFHAACEAALALRGKGKDDPAPDRDARLGLVSLALGWLEEERAAWEARFPGRSVADRAQIVAALNHWKHNPDLVALRSRASVEALPPSHRDACRAFWARIDAMLGRATGKTP